MVKKCEACKMPIDVSRGGYVNLYTLPFELHAYHTNCYDAMVIEFWEKEKSSGNLERWGRSL